jgi:SpoVK/Ycf46/Vps4 family AAA+-type ATPase
LPRKSDCNGNGIVGGCAICKLRLSAVTNVNRWRSRRSTLASVSTLGTAQKGKLLVFDDIHLICPKRGGYSAGSDRLTATLLALIDGISIAESGSVTQNIVILAITTNPSFLDPALRRPGRIDSEVEVPIPDEASTRSEILQFQLTV